MEISTLADWRAVATAAIGLVLGFLLKTVADMVTRRSERAREDRLRFIDRRLDAAVDFTAAVTRVMDSYVCMRMLDRHQRSLVDEYDDLGPGTLATEARERVTALTKSLQDLVAERHDLMEGLRSNLLAAHRAAALVGVLCGEAVKHEARRVTGSGSRKGRRVGL